MNKQSYLGEILNNVTSLAPNSKWKLKWKYLSGGAVNSCLIFNTACVTTYMCDIITVNIIAFLSELDKW